MPGPGTTLFQGKVAVAELLNARKDRAGVPGTYQLALIHPEHARTDTADKRCVMSCQHHDAGAPNHAHHSVDGAGSEGCIARAKDLVDKQHLRRELGRYRKSQAHIHARRISAHRKIDKLADISEINDLLLDRTEDRKSVV